MRTVDPEQWCKKLQKPTIGLTRQIQFGRTLPGDLETRIRHSFSDAWREYWENCSVKGVNRTLDRGLSKSERCRNSATLAAVMLVGVAVLSSHLYKLQHEPPMQVKLQSSQHTIQRIPFPAVALCSTNVISNTALEKYVKFLHSKDYNNSYQDVHKIRINLLKFGSLLTKKLEVEEESFMRLLAHAEPLFNVTRLMYQFSSSCTSMLKRCSWRGRAAPCDALFAARITPLGFCCVFNSRYYPVDTYRRPKYLNIVGQDFGLSVIAQENTDDFAYIRRAYPGLEVLIFDGSEYPLLEGSGVRIYPVERNASVYMSLTAKAQYPADGAWSACKKRSASGSRSYAWCLAQCRRRTLAALCSCRLYTFAPDLADQNPICSISHLSCLNKHREKFIYYYPRGYDDPALNEELQNGQDCQLCSPDCTRYVYSASVSTARYSYTSRDKIFKNVFSRGHSLVNATIIRLFFASEHQKLYAIDVNMRWFEVFAMTSCEWSGIVGATMISVSEIVFYFTVRWAHHYRHRTRMAK